MLGKYSRMVRNESIARFLADVEVEDFSPEKKEELAVADEKDYRKAVASVSRRLNEQFLSSYMELDRDLCEKFGVTTGGVTEYINRLNNARFAPGRDNVLPRLVRYRNIRNKFSHEVGAIRRVDEITKVDVNWVRSFNRDVVRKRDPISAYLKKARRFARRRKLRHTFYIVAAAAIVILAIVIFFLLKG